MRDRFELWNQRAVVCKERLREPINWLPVPALLGFGMVLILMGHALLGTNPRTGHPPEELVFAAGHQKDAALWFAVTPMGGDVVVTTNDRRVFRWPQSARNLEPLAPFIVYLKERVKAEIEQATLARRVDDTQTTAVMATDQRLKYLHLRPILHALASAGVAHYAFETQLPPMTIAEGRTE